MKKRTTDVQKIFIFLNFLFPIFAYAALQTGQGKIGYILTQMRGILGSVIPVLMVLATIVFIWGVIKYVLSAGSDDRKKEAKNLIIWGLIALFVIVAMWGLVNVIGSTFGVEEPKIPRVPGDFNF